MEEQKADPRPFDFAAAFDTKSQAAQGFEFQLEDVNGRPVPVWWTVYGFDSDQYQNALRAQQRRRLDRAARGRRQQLTPEDLEVDSIELLVAATGSFRASPGVKMPDGQPFPEFSKAAAKDILTRYPVIREQVDRALADRANFLPRLATS